MSADYYALAVGLMCASAQETIYDRQLRDVVMREAMASTKPSIPPVPGAIAPVIGEYDKVKS